MNLTQIDPSESKRSSYFCKVCRVACLNRDGLNSHFEGDEHKKMEDTVHGTRYRTPPYKCLEDYISFPKRRVPLIGLQFIIQLNKHVDHPDAFKCTLCKLTGPLLFIIRHLKTFKHRISYLAKNYSHLFPLYSSQTSYLSKNMIVRGHALDVEREERELDFDVTKRCTSHIGVKNDFWKYLVKKQKPSEEKKEHSANEAQKESILKYMETFVIASAEEATLAQCFADDLEAAVNVFCQNTKSKHDYASKYEYHQNLNSKEGTNARDSDYKRNVRMYKWIEKDSTQSPSTSYCEDTTDYHSKRSYDEEDKSTKKRARYSSTDTLSMFTFTIDNSGYENKPKTSGFQKEHHAPSATSSTTEHAVMSTDYVNETIKELRRTAVGWGGSQRNQLRQDSADIEKWEALFKLHHPDKKHPKFSWGTNSPSLNSSEINTELESKERIRRTSLDALSTFTLFSCDAEPGSATSPFLSFKSPHFKVQPLHSVCDDEEDHPNENDDLKHSEQESCSQSLNLDNCDVSITETSYDNLIPSQQEQQDNCSFVHSGPESTSIGQHFDKPSGHFYNMCTGTAHTGESNQNRNTDSVQNADVEECVSGCSDDQNMPSAISENTSLSNKPQDSGRHLSPELLHLFKGKDTDNIIHILRTLAPFYPALQERNLEIFAKELSGNQ